MIRRIALAGWLSVIAAACWAQLVTTTPNTATIGSQAGFQDVLAATAVAGSQPRGGCMIYNAGSNSMKIYPDTAAVANTKSGGWVIVTPTGQFMCNDAQGRVIQNAISISGTNLDTYSFWTW